MAQPWPRLSRCLIRRGKSPEFLLTARVLHSQLLHKQRIVEGGRPQVALDTPPHQPDQLEFTYKGAAHYGITRCIVGWWVGGKTDSGANRVAPKSASNDVILPQARYTKLYTKWGVQLNEGVGVKLTRSIYCWMELDSYESAAFPISLIRDWYYASILLRLCAIQPSHIQDQGCHLLFVCWIMLLLNSQASMHTPKYLSKSSQWPPKDFSWLPNK